VLSVEKGAENHKKLLASALEATLLSGQMWEAIEDAGQQALILKPKTPRFWHTVPRWIQIGRMDIYKLEIQ